MPITPRLIEQFISTILFVSAPVHINIKSSFKSFGDFILDFIKFIFFASLLFGALFQGGAELDFEFQSITRDMVLLIQGMIILFSGALAYMFNPALSKIFNQFNKNGVDND